MSFKGRLGVKGLWITSIEAKVNWTDCYWHMFTQGTKFSRARERSWSGAPDQDRQYFVVPKTVMLHMYVGLQ